MICLNFGLIYLVVVACRSACGSPIVIVSSPESPQSSIDKLGSPPPNDIGQEEEHHPDRPLSCSTLGTTPARASPLRIDCFDEAYPEADIPTDSVVRPPSADAVSDITQACHNGEEAVQTLQPPASIAKRRRLSIERNDVSPVSSHFSETSDVRPSDEGFFAPVKLVQHKSCERYIITNCPLFRFEIYSKFQSSLIVYLHFVMNNPFHQSQ